MLIACLSRFTCSILLSAVGGSNFWLTKIREADLQESLLRGIFPTYSELVDVFGLDCFNKRIHFWGIELHKPYYSFKIFPCFWLVKTTGIIHHNQLLFTKFGKNLCHIESMTSKVEPSENYWTIDVRMTSKVQPAANYWTVDHKSLGTRLCYIWWGEKQRAEWRNSFKNE